MSQEEKARAYDEALVKARKYMDDGYTVLMPDLFPELKESEDERIRRQLINVCNDYLNGDYSAKPCLNDIKWLKKLLEKQKEQPTNEEMLRTLRVEYEKGVADTIAKYEQKQDSLTKYVYSKEDKKFIQDCANILVANDYATSAERLLSMFKQKPAEWSEEDENNLNKLLQYWDGIPLGLRSWVSGLPEKVGARPSWKPSEEQIEALDTVLEHEEEWVGSTRELEKANALYEQLKKLM